MSLVTDFLARPGLSNREFAIWSGAAVVMLAVHAGAALYLTRNPPESIGNQAIAPPLLVELAPLVQSVAEPEEAEPVTSETPPETVEPEEEAPPDTVETETAEPIETAEGVEEPVTQEIIEEPVTEEVVETPPEPLEVAQAEPLEAEELPEPTPVETVEAVQPEPEPDVILPESDVPLPVVRPEPRRAVEREQPRPQRQRPRAERPREQPRAERPRRAAPPPVAASRPRASRATTANWQRQVQARLNRFKRYPAGADGANGVARVRVSINGAGQVTGSTITRSSGNAALDQAAVAMMQRAGRVPAPPDGASKTLTVPVNFSERR